jgi:major vault protein
MAQNDQRERDLVLPANEYALILDQTKGHISVHTGPTKQSLSATDQPVKFNSKARRFEHCDLSESRQSFILAPQGSYVQLENPSNDDHNPHPTTGSSQATPKLSLGQKINIPGPVAFALWPQQSARVIEGHTLASNQYLLVRVYDDVSARENLAAAVVKTVDDGSEGKKSEELIKADELAIGKLIVIKGTAVNFFIPPTGLEVVPDTSGVYVREAVSLERLEYCLLLNQNGTKRYLKGPAVVFPEPTETFVEEDDVRKFRAIELNLNSGIHVKVISSYKDEATGKDYLAGDELFITGKEQRIYFPREEHAIIRHNSQQIHHGVTLPRGEARYVLDKDKGVIECAKGPQIFLPDPRKQIIVKRILTESQCALMYPDNSQALQYNKHLTNQFQAQQAVSKDSYTRKETATRGRITKGVREPNTDMMYLSASAAPAAAAFSAASSVVGDSFDYDTTDYQQPQSITIDNKFDGAVTISPWTGYAVVVKNKAGDREVVLGPATRILDYDEELEVLALSTGKPKDDRNLLKTVYLQVENNKVSDIIDVETSDFTKARILVSFRVNFVGDSKKWFNVANYTKLLSEHMRSRVRRMVMQHNVEYFYRNAADIVRDVVLGPSVEGESRKGFTFTENNMHIYDVEVLEVELLDHAVQNLLASVQREGIDHTLRKVRLDRDIEAARMIGENSVQKLIIAAEADKKKNDLHQSSIKDAQALELVRHIAQQEKTSHDIETAKSTVEIHEINLTKDALTLKQKIEQARQENELRAEELKNETESVVEKAKAISPHLISALQTFGDRVTIERLGQALSPFGIIDMIRGASVTDTIKRLLKGSPVENGLNFVKIQLPEDKRLD